jgi:hypothetical protein
MGGFWKNDTAPSDLIMRKVISHDGEKTGRYIVKGKGIFLRFSLM